MSWFGEHLTSLTDKITDFTKDMLPDSGSNSATDDQQSQSDILPQKQLLELCKQKDDNIKFLMNEKASLDKSIEELELQHQEAVNKLLDLKNAAVRENHILKEELALQKECASAKLLFQKFEHNYHPRELRTSKMHSIPEDIYTLQNFNLVNMIGILWKSYTEGTLSSFLLWLKEQKYLLETQIVNVGNNSVDIIKRLNNYILFLDVVAKNSVLFSPLIDEIATVIHFLLLNHTNESSRFSVPENINRHMRNNHLTDNNSSSSGSKIEGNDYNSQPIIHNFEPMRDLFSINPEPLCNNSAETKPNSAAFTLSQHVQTDNEDSSHNCNSELRQYTLQLEQEKSILERESFQYVERILSLQEQLPSTLPAPASSVFVQTDNIQNEISSAESKKCTTSSVSVQSDEFDINTDKNKLVELEAYINILEQDKLYLHNKLIEFQAMMHKPSSSVLTQTDFGFHKPSSSVLTQTDVGSNNDTKLIELEAYVNILEQEKQDIQDKLVELQCLTDKSTFSVLTQTDSFTCDCNVPELEAGICILEQEKSDLIEELSYLQSIVDKPKSSVHIQTQESFVANDMLQSEIFSLQEVLSFKEREYSDILQELNNDFNNFKEELKSKDSIIQETENKIQSLECDLEKHKKFINDLTIRNQQVTSVDTQTDENGCSCKRVHELEIAELMKSMDMREKEYNAMEEEATSNINHLREELNSCQNVIANKDSILNNANLELENCRCKIDNLTEELNSLRHSATIAENACLCKKYELEIKDLKDYINEKEENFITTENDFISSANSLRELLQGKDSLLTAKEETIHSLKLELEEAKISIKNHFDDLKAFKAKQDYAKDIDTTKQCDIKMIMETCNRCQSILNGESNDNDLKNEIRVLHDKLKALDMDKSQLLCVLNEKSQECSSLKAEVHKLTNIVASEKQALNKLQQDNCLLRESTQNTDPELTKEAIQNLSRIIRDKDLEIESLKQKNVTLTALIQDAASVPDHMQSLIEEKEDLTKQINVFKADRDKIMLKYNTIDKDCRHYAAEVKKLKSALSDQKEKFDVLEQKHFSVAQQYEEKQKSLINTQNEMIALKQRVSDLEQQQVDIKEKYSELLNKFNSDMMVQINKDELNEKNSKIEQLMSANSEKDNLIEEKDCLIHDLSQQVKTLKLEHEQQQLHLSSLQAKVDELAAKLKEYETTIDKHQNEKDAQELRFQDKCSELGLLKDMNERLNMSLKEKEFTIQSMTEKISSLSHYISSDHTTSETLDINQILADSESMFSKAQSLYKERDETLLALNQSRQENQSLRNEIQRMKSSEIHLKKELERLRMHLLEIEENYTTEALKSEEREKELRDELAEVKRRAEISNTAIVDTNQRASIQIASLQEQLSMIANQRDQALAQVSTLEDKVQQHSTSVSKLQLVLEQMQRGNERKVKDTEKKFIALLENQKQLFKEMNEKLQDKEMQLEESTQALEAASRLSEQLDAKEEVIANLKSELSKTESKIKSTAQEIDTIKSNTEGKVDRVVMKSLVLGYFSTPPGQKSEVIRLLARVLDFNQEEMEKAGIVVGRNIQKNEQKGLFSSLFSRLPGLSSESSPPPPEKSFTTLFVQFLENESQPIVPIPFPVERMAHDLPFKHHTSKKSPTSERKNISRSNPLLLDIDSAFPTFTPVPAVEYSQNPAPSILREVLE